MNKFTYGVSASLLSSMMLVSSTAFAATLTAGSVTSSDSNATSTTSVGTSANLQTSSGTSTSQSSGSINSSNAVGNSNTTNTNVTANDNSGIGISLTRNAVIQALQTGTLKANTSSSASSWQNVGTNSDLSTFASTMIGNDENIQNVNSNSDTVSMRYREPGKFLAIIPIHMTTTATVKSDGTVTFSRPWYSFLVQSDASTKDSFESSMSSITGSGSTGFSSTMQAQILAKMHSIFSSKGSADASTNTDMNIDTNSSSNNSGTMSSTTNESTSGTQTGTGSMQPSSLQ